MLFKTSLKSIIHFYPLKKWKWLIVFIVFKILSKLFRDLQQVERTNKEQRFGARNLGIVLKPEVASHASVSGFPAQPPGWVNCWDSQSSEVAVHIVTVYYSEKP